MESTGLSGKIHLTQETANRLISAGKGNWVIPRETKVNAKGKGEMQTYWISPDLCTPRMEENEQSIMSCLGKQISGMNLEAEASKHDNISNLVERNVSIFADLIREMVSAV